MQGRPALVVSREWDPPTGMNGFRLVKYMDDYSYVDTAKHRGQHSGDNQ